MSGGRPRDERHLDKTGAEPGAVDEVEGCVPSGTRVDQGAQAEAGGCAAVPRSPHFEGENTTRLTTADKWGNVVAYTLTIESTGGSAITVPGRGFLLNSELTDFSFAPANRQVRDTVLKGLITEVYETNFRVCGDRKVWRELHRQGHEGSGSKAPSCSRMRNG